jgi:hypothetical protein
MKTTSTVQAYGKEILKEQKLTIGVDLGDRWLFYCVLDEAGKIILEQKVLTTPEAAKQTFWRIPQSRIAQVAWSSVRAIFPSSLFMYSSSLVIRASQIVRTTLPKGRPSTR